jgi:hypothetical protein
MSTKPATEAEPDGKRYVFESRRDQVVSRPIPTAGPGAGVCRSSEAFISYQGVGRPRVFRIPAERTVAEMDIRKGSEYRWNSGCRLLSIVARWAARRLNCLSEPQFASGSGRNWMCTARGLEPLPPSLSQGVRSPFVLHNPRPFHPAFGSSIRPSKPLA